MIQPLIVGDGPAVESGQTVTVQYVGVKWSDGSVFDSSWERGQPVDFPVGTGGVIAGFEEGLIGQTVGSRVMLIIPPDKGYGEQGNDPGRHLRHGDPRLRDRHPRRLLIGRGAVIGDPRQATASGPSKPAGRYRPAQRFSNIP